MKKRIFTAAMACALALSLLAACGPKGGDNSSAQGSVSGSGSDVSTSTPADGSASTPDASEPDASTGDVSEPDSSKEPDDNTVVAALSLNRSDFTLFKAGATFQLKAQGQPTGGTFTWTSGDEAVATVSDKGLVTAVAPGHTTVTVTDSKTGLSAECIVRCDWSDEKPDEKPDEGGSSSEEKPSAGSVDLSAFASDIMGKYEFGFLELLGSDLMDGLYPGMSAVNAEQKLIYGTMMTMNNGEFGLVQVKDSKDVSTVKGIFQARIDGMVNGGAWYPGPTEQWTNNSRVVSNGNYVMMIVHENCDDIVAAFNDLF